MFLSPAPVVNCRPRILLFLNHISLFQFRNYRSAELSFSGRVVGLHGRNGAGKTNLLDAIHYCCFSRSYFGRNDALLVTQHCKGFRLEAGFRLNNEDHGLQIILRENGKKEIRSDGVLIPRISQFIGKYPAVMVCPDDTELIAGSSEERRRFMDMLLSQIDADYLDSLIQYNRVLQQRNTYLKQSAMDMRRDEMLLDTYDRMLQDPAVMIHQKRSTYISALISLAKEHYRRISGENETVDIQYESQLNKSPLLSLLQQTRERDYAAQRTLCGIHKDELSFSLDGNPFKGVASQGQRKSLLFSLKLAEFDMLQKHKGFAPLLLLDDVFEKLDENRMHHLLQRVCVENQGQVFLTDTHKERISSHFRELGVEVELREINSGG